MQTNLDTKCFNEALAETNLLAQVKRSYSELPIDTQSYVLRRAQEIKAAYLANRKEGK